MHLRLQRLNCSIQLIIVQCLNWNHITSTSMLFIIFLIIVQCLNWNIDKQKELDEQIRAYNRTMLELKSKGSWKGKTLLILIIVQCLNWNTSGCQLCYNCYLLIIVQCLNWNDSNRPNCLTCTLLIIVQCLNWNTEKELLKQGKLFSYNRTMLELKSAVQWVRQSVYKPYNRTMLELKWQ